MVPSLPSSHGSCWLVPWSPARLDEQQRCHGDCLACVLFCRQHRAPGSLCSPPASLASEQVTGYSRHVFSHTLICMKKKVKRWATAVFSVQNLLCAGSLHPNTCIISFVFAVPFSLRRTKASWGQGNRRAKNWSEIAALWLVCFFCFFKLNICLFPTVGKRHSFCYRMRGIYLALAIDCNSWYLFWSVPWFWQVQHVSVFNEVFFFFLKFKFSLWCRFFAQRIFFHCVWKLVYMYFLGNYKFTNISQRSTFHKFLALVYSITWKTSSRNKLWELCWC